MMKLLEYHIHRMLPHYRTYGSEDIKHDAWTYALRAQQSLRDTGIATTHIRPQDATAIGYHASNDQSKCLLLEICPVPIHRLTEHCQLA